MNKLCLTILASSLLLCGAVRVAEAQTGRAMIADTPIRGEASLASPIIATLREGGLVDVVDVQPDWFRVLVPNEKGKPRVGYVLSRLIEIVNAAGSPQTVMPATMSRVPPPILPGAPSAAQGPSIPPTLAQAQRQHERTMEREDALKAEVDALQEQVRLLQNPPGSIDARRQENEAIVQQQATQMDERGVVQRPRFAARKQPGDAQYEIYGAYSPFWDYSYVDSSRPLGWVVSFAHRLNASVTIVGEAGGGYGSGGVLGISSPGFNTHTFTVGPRFSKPVNRNVTVYGQILGGLAFAHVSTLSVSSSSTGFAVMPGAGVDIPIGHRVGVRLGGETGFIQESIGWYRVFRFTTGLVVSR